ncbi:MAG: hypothetical protein J0L84_15610 [Verrucomicrobia bacterium]|nr:hypothetical protein [Verrucomicrobiota bacterium]
MSRSRSNEVQEMRWGRLAFVGLTVAAIAALTVGYTLQRGAHDALGQEIKAMEKKEAWAKAEVLVLRERLARQRRRDVILRQVQEMGLNLTNIVPNQRRLIPLLPSWRPAESPFSRSNTLPASSLSAPRNREALLRPLTGAAALPAPHAR